MNKQIDLLEKQEIIQKLINNGFKELVEALLENEAKVYTKRLSRLNKSGACRVLGWKTKKLEDTLLECRKLLEKDI